MNNMASIKSYFIFTFAIVLALLIGLVAGKAYFAQEAKTPTGAVAGAPSIDPEKVFFQGGKPEVIESIKTGGISDETRSDEAPAVKIIKEYAPGDVEVLRERALYLVKNSECYKQEYTLGLSRDEEEYKSFYSTNKVVNLVYDFNEQFHGWIVFKLVKINKALKTDSLKVNIDVANDQVSCEDINLYYTDKKA